MQIGEISKITGLSISTLRYYDKHGLLPDINRTEGGIRIFSKDDLDSIRMIECLKNSGMKISEIKHFMDLCRIGDTTIRERRDIFFEQEVNINNQITLLENALKLIKFKQWYYSKALEDGTVNKVKNMSVEDMPLDIQKLYKETH